MSDNILITEKDADSNGQKMQSIQKVDKAVKAMSDFTSPEVLYDELIASVKKYHPSTDISLIEKAYKTAKVAHEGQKRKSGARP